MEEVAVPTVALVLVEGEEGRGGEEGEGRGGGEGGRGGGNDE